MFYRLGFSIAQKNDIKKEKVFSFSYFYADDKPIECLGRFIWQTLQNRVNLATRVFGEENEYNQLVLGMKNSYNM